MNKLSSELILEIFKCFSYKQLKHLSCVNKEYNKSFKRRLNELLIVIKKSSSIDVTPSPSNIFNSFNNINIQLDEIITEIKNSYNIINEQVGYEMLSVKSVACSSGAELNFNTDNLITHVKIHIKFQRRNNYCEYDIYNVFVFAAREHERENLENERENLENEMKKK